MNYVLLTYYPEGSYWSNEQVCTQIALRQQTDTPNIVTDSCRATRSWSVMVHAGICQHGLARSSAISRQHTTMCVDIATQYPHKHHATFTLFYSTLIPKSKMTINMPHQSSHGDLLSPSRTSARTLGEAKMALRVSLVQQMLLSLVLQIIPLSDPFSIVIYPKPLTTSASSKAKSNAKHFRYLCKQKKK